MSALDECIAIADSIEGEDQFTGVAINARGELAALRDSERYWQQTAEQERANAAEQRERAEKLRATVEAQARQLEEARRLLTELDWNDWDERVDAWLAANAPQAQHVAVEDERMSDE